ncbi:MAG: hypothetical protein JWM91_3876 [Rhodospirillales bacterium]|nr:hypothetical protein [Rhodospirillales bacterium]
MSDDKSKASKPDHDRIKLNEDYELPRWSKKFGVTPEQLKAAPWRLTSSDISRNRAVAQSAVINDP